MSRAMVVCQEREAECRCALELDHNGPHECACSGSWEWRDGSFVIVRLPDPEWRSA